MRQIQLPWKRYRAGAIPTDPGSSNEDRGPCTAAHWQRQGRRSLTPRFFSLLASFSSLLLGRAGSFRLVSRGWRTAPIVAVLLFATTGCQRMETLEVKGAVMGTSYSVKIVTESPESLSHLGGEIQSKLNEFNALFSNWEPESDVSRFNRHRSTEPFELSPHTAAVVANALRVAALTDGALDPTLGPLIELWGFGTKAAVSVPERAEIEETLTRTGYAKLRLSGSFLRKSHPELTLNLSANAKGYAVDQVAAFLKERGIDRFMVEIGGEVRVAGLNLQGNPWRLAIENPNAPPMLSIFKIAGLTDKAMATSGDYRNFFIFQGIKYSHILNPKTGMPIPTGVASVTVIADDCMTADALATGFMVLSPDRSLEIADRLEGVECLILEYDGVDKFHERRSLGMVDFLVKSP